MPEMEQFMISVPGPLLDRMDALRIVMGTSRAQVGRQALEMGGLAQLEQAQAPRLAQLEELAGRMGYPTWNALVGALVAHYGQKTPNLDELAGKLFAKHTFGHRLPSREQLDKARAGSARPPRQRAPKADKADAVHAAAAEVRGLFSG